MHYLRNTKLLNRIITSLSLTLKQFVPQQNRFVLVIFISCVLASSTIAYYQFLPKPVTCLDNRWNRMNLSIQVTTLYQSMRPINADTASKLQEIAILDTNMDVSGNLLLGFSPSNYMLAITGIGDRHNASTRTYLWNLAHEGLCIQEIGNGESLDPREEFVAFSPDGRQMLLRRYHPVFPMTLWEIENNRLIGEYASAAFVPANGEIVFEYMRQRNGTVERSPQSWIASPASSLFFEVSQEDNSILIFDSLTRNDIAAIQPTYGKAEYAAISSDGRIIAISSSYPHEGGYSVGFVQLWGIPE